MIRASHKYRLILTLIIMMIGQMMVHASSKDTSNKYVRLSLTNGYPIYSDVQYSKASFLGEPSWSGWEKFTRPLITFIAIPQISASFSSNKMDFILESRFAPGTNLYTTDGPYPKPIERNEFAIHGFIGKRIDHHMFNHRIAVGVSGRYLESLWAITPDDDFFASNPYVIHFEPGVALKYEFTRYITSDKSLNFGVGINQAYYLSGIHVMNVGLVLGYNFTRIKG